MPVDTTVALSDTAPEAAKDQDAGGVPDLAWGRRDAVVVVGQDATVGVKRDAAPTTDPPTEKHGGGGCSMAAAGTSEFLPVLFGLALLVAGLRRRQR